MTTPPNLAVELVDVLQKQRRVRLFYSSAIGLTIGLFFIDWLVFRGALEFWTLMYLVAALFLSAAMVIAEQSFSRAILLLWLADLNIRIEQEGE